MNNTQFYFALGVPFFAVVLMYIVGTISNRAVINDLRSEMRAGINDLRSEMRAGMNDLRSEMHAGFSALNVRMDSLEKRMDRVEKRLDTIDTEIRINHDHRLAVLEARILGRAS